jgi:FlaA1/EpsC-like NDP-sugar epimerase
VEANRDVASNTTLSGDGMTTLSMVCSLIAKRLASLRLVRLAGRDAYLRRLAKVLIDASACTGAVAASYLLRFPPGEALLRFQDKSHIWLLIIGLEIIGFAVLRLYSAFWRYTGYESLMKLVAVVTLSLAFGVGLSHALGLPVPQRSTVALCWFLTTALCSGARLTRRHMHELKSRRSRPSEATQQVLIYGAGNAGENLLRSIDMAADIHIHVVGFVDDDPLKLGNTMRNRRVLGNRHRIGELARKHHISDIYLAIPSLSGKQFRDVLDAVLAQVFDRVRIHTLPGIVNFANGRVAIEQMRKVEIGDLLRRSPVHLDHAPVHRLVRGQPVMVVGGGGSIGSELCKQIASLEPSYLVVVDSSEFNTYQIDSELRRLFPELSIYCLVADAGSMPIMHRIFSEYRPAYVFHAAAYKHVPLMEAHPWAAVVNNLACTLTLTELASQFRVKRFVLVSSDKAVRPTNVMGATKRICEIITLTQNRMSSTDFLAVRFGNVLGSSGSVIPKFAQQIARGGPVTVTHPDITRYFMLIPEAVELVLQAAAAGERGNIYVLDMGDPVRIADLARHMIQLSGADPDNDIRIEYTGLRPGEKLHESLYFEGDESATQIPNLFVLTPKLTTGVPYLERSRQLVISACSLERVRLLNAIKELAPEYQPELEPAPRPIVRQARTAVDAQPTPMVVANG